MFNFSENIIKWQKQHGRHSLPWQITPTPYHVWVSEVMLQQTQVTTVIPYFNRFIDKCPTVESLAALDSDELMQLWQGLGYYSRARNLHKAAKMITDEYDGVLPLTRQELEKLPGIGRSTAAAIMSLAYQSPDAILDGNAKRVFLRYNGITEDPKATATINKLWEIAEQCLPKNSARAYTQGLMDLGANICKRSKPSCEYCPLKNECTAYTTSITHLIPAKSPKKKPQAKPLFLLICIKNNQIGFIKRPSTGIWAELYSPLIYDCYEDLYQHGHTISLPSYQHQLTHLTLTIYPFITNEQCDAVTHWEPINAITLAIPTGVKRGIELAKQWTANLENLLEEKS